MVARAFSPAEPPPVDMAHLNRYTGGERALNAEVLRLFETQTTEMVARLSQILAARDAKEWREIMHTLKGAARGIGAFAFADAAAAAEPIDPARDAAGAEEAVARMRESSLPVQRFIADYIEKRA